MPTAPAPPGGHGCQGTLLLEVISKGRFEKIEPMIHQDFDVPTYIRRGVALN